MTVVLLGAWTQMTNALEYKYVGVIDLRNKRASVWES